MRTLLLSLSLLALVGAAQAGGPMCDLGTSIEELKLKTPDELRKQLCGCFHSGEMYAKFKELHRDAARVVVGTSVAAEERARFEEVSDQEIACVGCADRVRLVMRSKKVRETSCDRPAKAPQ